MSQYLLCALVSHELHPKIETQSSKDSNKG